MSSFRGELRPVYTGEPTTITVTIDGSGSIASETFTGALYDPSGSEIADAVTVEITDAGARVLTITVAGQSAVGDHTLTVRRTDDDSDLLTYHAVLEITDPTKP